MLIIFQFFMGPLCLFFDSDGKLFWSEWKKFFYLPLCLFCVVWILKFCLSLFFCGFTSNLVFFLEKMVKSSFIVFQSISVSQVFFGMIDGRIEKMGLLRSASDSLVLKFFKIQTISITKIFSSNCISIAVDFPLEGWIKLILHVINEHLIIRLKWGKSLCAPVFEFPY